MDRLVMFVNRLVRTDEGQDLLEYAMLVALIALVAVGAIQRVGDTINTVLWQAIVAGDVKLMAALGTWLGPAGVLMAVLYGAIAGGVLAVAHAINRRRLGRTISRTVRLVAAPRDAKTEIDRAAATSRFAYGPAIAIGAIAAALLMK